MNCTKKIILLFLLLGVTQFASAQFFFKQKYEYGWWGGTTLYSGDINPTLQNYPKTLSIAGGVFSRVNLGTRWAVKTGLNYGRISGSDAYSNREFEQMRNLSFFTDIFEFSTHLEFNFLDFEIKRNKRAFSPYLFIGLGAMYYEPKTEYNGEVVKLRTLGTEGQFSGGFLNSNPYDAYSLVLPVGGGLKYNVSFLFSLGLEFGYRRVFTDHLDDISGLYVSQSALLRGNDGDLRAALADRSQELNIEAIGIAGRQRGDSQTRDSYSYLGITFSYTFAKSICPNP